MDSQSPWGLLITWCRQRRLLLLVPPILAILAALAALLTPTEWASRAVIEFPVMASALDMSGAADKIMPGAGLLSSLQDNDKLKRMTAIITSERVRERLCADPKLRPALMALLGTRDDRKLSEALGKRLTCRLKPGQVIEVEVALPGPSRLASWVGGRSTKSARNTCAMVAQSAVDELRTYLTHVSASHERSEITYLDPQVSASYRRLQTLQAQVLALAGGEDPAPPSKQHPLLAEGLGKLEEQQASASVQLAAAQRQLATARRQLASVPQEVVSGRERSRNTQIEYLQKTLTEAETRLRVLRDGEGKSDRHPDVRAQLETVSSLRAQLRQVASAPLVVAGEHTTRNPDYDALRKAHGEALLATAAGEAQVAVLARLRQQTLQRVRNLGGRELTEARLQTEIQVETALYGFLRRALQEAKLREQRALAVFVVLDAPRVPERKTGPSAARQALMGLLAGLFILIVVVQAEGYLREAVERGVQSVEATAKAGEAL